MANPINATINYVKSSAAELKKVTWPTRAQTIRYSALVIAVSIGVAVFFASLDYGFSSGIMLALSKTPHSTAQQQTQEAAPAVVPDVQSTPVSTPDQVKTVQPSTPAATDQKNTGTQAPIQLPSSNDIKLPKN
jgi:preprotein translocase subunit SecE